MRGQWGETHLDTVIREVAAVRVLEKGTNDRGMAVAVERDGRVRERQATSVREREVSRLLVGGGVRERGGE